MNFKLPERIFFTGFMATGKSRLSELVSVALGWRFLDTDKLIEKETGFTINEIFSSKGEDYFRNLEQQILTKVCEEKQVVIALGGGTLKNPWAVNLIKQSGILIGLWATPETILERVNRKDTRPLLSNLNNDEKLKKIITMLDERKELYENADFKIESREDIPHHVLTKKIITRIQIEGSSPLIVDLKERSYPIYIHNRLDYHLAAVAEKTGCPTDYIIATDSNLKIHQRDLLRDLSLSLGKCRVFFFRPGEKEKNLSSVNRLYSYMLKHQFSRKTTLIALGGGVVGDMVGFVAATYLRGVPFIQFPTTLLSMVDSSVGGKTGVNHRMGKNLIGAFYQPKAVLINTSALSTLPEEEFKAGLAEVIKYAIIWDRNFFDTLMEKCDAILQKEPEILKQVIHRCCQIKAEVVSQDERESGIRAILNYGHTFGHAIETLNRYSQITHGLAVALGMRVAIRLAKNLNRVSSETEDLHNSLLDKFNMPKAWEVDKEKAWEAMALDKKVVQGKRLYILPSAIGKVDEVSEITKEEIFKAWESIQP